MVYLLSFGTIPKTSHGFCLLPWYDENVVLYASLYSGQLAQGRQNWRAGDHALCQAKFYLVLDVKISANVLNF